MSTPSREELDALLVLAETKDELRDEPAQELTDRAPTTEEAAAARVGTTIDQYEILGVLGHGAMGTVYRARHRLLAHPYALKILDAHPTASEARAKRFLREAHAAAQLEHPNVVHVVYSGITPEGEAFLVMELLEGRSLAEVVAEGPLAAERAGAIARQLALGLEAIHARGFLHRDIKPSNVMLSSGPGGEQVKILDLGLVGSIEPEQSELRLTQQGHVMGTPMYMAPETFTHNTFTPQSDLYALGVVLHEMLAGSPPFHGSIKELLWHHCFTAPPALPSARGLEEVVARLLAKDVSGRYRSAREVVEDLDRRAGRSTVAELVEDGPARLARSMSRAFGPQPQPVGRRRSPVGAVLLAAALFGGVAVAAMIARGGSGATPVAGAAEAEAERAPAEADPESARPSVAERAAVVAAPGEAVPSVPVLAPPVVPAEAASRSSVGPAPSSTVHGAPSPAPPSARARAVRGVPREVMVTSDPPGARVETDAGILGLTPISVLVVGGRPTVLTLHLEGHEPRRVRLGPDARAPAVHVRFGAER